MRYRQSSVDIGAWVSVESGTEVRCNPCNDGESVIVSFNSSEFELVLDHDVLKKCVTTFTEALNKMAKAKETEETTQA
ncbi:hypothetical protein [Streptoalloteichus hindustanus]|uniref:Uncharacterized protein n=1 Tax=Streptoalloteichus hindustanus TaxID=2017 RepID=A0A1M5L7G8_STRHI|nr:hypothetical protein [Streptoalloteichus hindustanus]SHG60865.1 hypothetical protein SAMN05444320_11110 [Streptoalloteichus hindustanus]